MFPWVKIVKKSPPSPALTTSLTPVPDESMEVNESPSQSLSTPAVPETSASSFPATDSTTPLTKRQIKNQRRKANRLKRKEMFAASGAVLYKGAKRLESQARNQQNRANRVFKTGLIHAKDAAEYSALTKEQFQPFFTNAESSFAHRDQCLTRGISRQCLDSAQGGVINSLRLKEAAKAARKGDLNPVEPEFKIKSVEKHLHRSYFK